MVMVSTTASPRETASDGVIKRHPSRSQEEWSQPLPWDRSIAGAVSGGDAASVDMTYMPCVRHALDQLRLRVPGLVEVAMSDPTLGYKDNLATAASASPYPSPSSSQPASSSSAASQPASASGAAAANPFTATGSPITNTGAGAVSANIKIPGVKIKKGVSPHISGAPAKSDGVPLRNPHSADPSSSAPPTFGGGGRAPRPGRIGSLQFKSDHFRKIRLTYMDCGSAIQVFNFVCYPDPDVSDAPILGVDLLSLPGGPPGAPPRHLAVVDFQPLSKSEEYLEVYSAPMGPVRAQHPGLQEEVSRRFYEDDRFFSPHMLFGRPADASAVRSEVFPAFQDYLNLYLDMVASSVNEAEHIRASSPGRLDSDAVRKRHAEFDEFNAVRDPALGLFAAYFGRDWAHNFVDSFLFEYQEPEEESAQ